MKTIATVIASLLLSLGVMTAPAHAEDGVPQGGVTACPADPSYDPTNPSQSCEPAVPPLACDPTNPSQLCDVQCEFAPEQAIHQEYRVLVVGLRDEVATLQTQVVDVQRVADRQAVTIQRLRAKLRALR